MSISYFFQKKSINITLLIFIINFSIWLIGNLFHLKISPDGYYYLLQADYIQNNGLFGFLKVNLLTPYYWGFPIFIYLNQILFGIYFKLSILIIQFILTCIIPIFLAEIYKIIFKQNLSILVILFFVFSLDILQWANFLLTDIYSLFLAVFFIYILMITKRLNTWVILLIIPTISILMITFRGSNVTILLAAVVYGFIGIRKEKLAGSLILLILALVLVLSLFSGNQNKNAFSLKSRYSLFVENIKRGEVINDRPNYDIEPFREDQYIYFYTAKLYFIRAFNYLRFYSSSFSNYHNIYNCIYFSTLYLSVLFYLFSGKFQTNNKNQNLIFVIIILSFLSTIITMIDYDWRYRVPVLSLLILFSVQGCSVAYSKWKSLKLI